MFFLGFFKKPKNLGFFRSNFPALPRTRTELEPYVYKLNKNLNRTEPW